MPSDEARSDFARMIRERIVPTLREAGYRGTAPTWVRTSDLGDFAVVNIQRSRAWMSDEELMCFYVNLAIVPAPWWEWVQFRHGPAKGPKEFHGIWRERLRTGEPSYPGDSWAAGSPESAREAGEDVSNRLRTIGLPLLAALLDRETLVTALDYWRPNMSSAAILSDEGPSDEIERLLGEERGDGWDDYRRWVRARARAAAGTSRADWSPAELRGGS